VEHFSPLPNTGKLVFCKKQILNYSYLH